ncbi:Ca2+-dependent phosphoinositide-specific phospholipase C [Polaribacter sargassicola]|uniref:Ca2+-dependent phosphoinositide-specific phospholipase C n=1 Tax=Polaribacter sargassicola TaxID=2836891 RepID=UPI001F4777AD|nr:Ca2+-dependent phosphoinositide-specific phospholipase C [Polaribacter sp. DS7-9]MCG1035040.1 hypothetical protein [Polaribacter sp. DS7-9]
MKKLITSLFIGSILLVCSCKKESSQFSLENNTIKIDETLKINQIQVLGTHNSYAKPVDEKVFTLMNPIFKKLMGQYNANMTDEQKAKMKEYHPNEMPLNEMLNYNHPDFKTQLDAGLRSLELDIYYDPTGNRFNKPATYEILKQQGITNLAPFDTVGLSKPGFKLLHMADIDFRTHYPTFKGGLKALKKWSNNNPTHAPIFIMIEAKDSGFPIFPNSAKVLPFTEQAFDEMDALVKNTLGRDKLITPDDVRGGYATLEEAVLAKNWPLLKESKGKFIFLLLPSGGGLASKSDYVKNHPVLENRVMFVQSEIGQKHAAFLLLDNAIVRQTEIQEAVKKGYLVRTRSDIETYEAKTNDMTRANAAFTSGAQVISTDFFRPGNNYNTDYWVKIPNGKPMRTNPINTKN